MAFYGFLFCAIGKDLKIIGMNVNICLLKALCDSKQYFEFIVLEDPAKIYGLRKTDLWTEKNRISYQTALVATTIHLWLKPMDQKSKKAIVPCQTKRAFDETHVSSNFAFV